VKVYDTLMAFLAILVRDLRVEVPTVMQLYRETREADFLFGPEIPDLIDRVAKSALEHHDVRLDGAIASGDVPRI
jgi:hypothetical protein